MNKAFLIPTLFLLHGVLSFGQGSDSKILFVVDSIPVIDDPDEGDEILQSDVADITVIKNRDTLNSLGYSQFDGVTFIFTKEFRNRPDSLKQIPSSKRMNKLNGVWFFRGSPYSGRFIDYYYSGRKQGEGTFANGKVSGLRKMYFQNGKIEVEKYYKDGLENGLDKEYYEDGSLRQKGEFVNGMEEGIWEDYYPNGQVKLSGNYSKGEIYGTAIKYYSNGKIKEKVLINGDKVIPDPNLKKIEELMNRSNQRDKEGDSKSAIKYCNQVIAIDSTFADAYFAKGTLELNDLQFDNAISDFNKALEIEPYLDVALANRAFARIRKYQFQDSRTLSKSSDVTVLASADKVSMPADAQQLVCDDLHKAIFLGDKAKMITEALSNYCGTESSR